MKFFEGPWIIKDEHAINYLRGFRNVTFDIEAVSSNFYLTPEYWIDENYYINYAIGILLIITIYFTYSAYNLAKSDRADVNAEKPSKIRKYCPKCLQTCSFSLLKTVMISKLLVLLFLQNYDVISDFIYLLTTPLVNKPLMYPLLILSLLAAPVIVFLITCCTNEKNKETIKAFFGHSYVKSIKKIWERSANEFDKYSESAKDIGESLLKKTALFAGEDIF
jgi:hypothetical protein